MEPLVSIIIPTYNEEADIGRTLEALVKLRYPHKEIIVVDDASSDSTVGIVKRYVKQYPFVELIPQPVNRGVASARNLGIRHSHGEILVILNADVFPNEDFLDRILPHYAKGADYVLVGSEVTNQQYLFPRYIEALSKFAYEGKDWIEWTEGFSCRKSAAVDVGLFPENIPGCGGEDAIFGMKLSQKYKKVIDLCVIVPHMAPQTFKDFWAQQQSRGRAVPYVSYYIYKQPFVFITLKLLMKFIYWPLRNIFEFPIFFIYYCYRSKQMLKRGWRDFFPFLYVKAIEMCTHRYGEWKGWREIFFKQGKV